MSAFREKSDNNFTASKVLQQNEHRLYDSSIHCAYYACVQELLHIIFNKKKIDRRQFDIDRRTHKDGTHGWAFRLIELDVAKGISHREFKWFQNAFRELKDLRETADYFEPKVTSSESLTALRLSEDMVKLLKGIFK